MDRVQIAAVAAAVALLAAWFLLLPAGPGEPGAEGAKTEAPAPVTQSAEVPTPNAPEHPADLARELPPAPPDASGDAMRYEMTQSDPLPGAPRPSAELITLHNDAVRLGVTPVGGRLERIELLDFADKIGPGAGRVELVTSAERGTMVLFLGEGPFRGLESLEHSVVRQSDELVELVAEQGGVEVRRTLALDPTGYGGRLRVVVRNRSEGPVRPEFRLVWYGVERDSNAPDHFMNYSLVSDVAGGLERRPVAGLGTPGFLDRILGRDAWRGDSFTETADWVGIDSQYFLTASIPVENPPEARAFFGTFGRNAGLSMLSYPPIEIPAGHYVERAYRLYLGPKVHASVLAVDPRLEVATQKGWRIFSPFVDLFAFLLVWTYEHVVSNYGLAIILLTILLRLVTFPLTQKSMTSMRRFSVIAPEMKALQEKHKGDREKLQQEMMALYQRKGINPIAAMGGGCLPMLIQFPFLIALYFALQSAIELRHAPFMLWIQDLSTPDLLFSVSGIPVRVLPLIMGATMVLQNRLMPTANVDPQQRQMMMWMSVMFIFLFYQFPSGLVLYWFVSNLLGIGQQILVNSRGAAAEAK